MKLLKRDSMSSRVEEMERVMNVLRSGSDIQASTLLARLRRQSTAPSGELTEDCQFLSLLFDRQDYLLPGSDSEDEDNSDAEFDKTLDPRLLFEGGKRPIESPMDMSVSRLSSPEKGENVRSIHVTHLRSRQPIVNTIRIHPNINLRNLFGNLPFSSSIRANNYPEDVQDTQVNNLFLPTWAMMTVSTRPDPGSVRTAFPSILQEATALLESGTPVEVVVEAHPNIAALFNENDFNASGILSRWAAGMVHSVMLKERMEWLMDMSNNLRCDWSFPAQEAFKKDDETGLLDVCDLAKTSLRDLSNWSVGPSFRGYVSNADSYVRIRVEGF
ncbi:hypothetical protein SLS59_007679 [Nothophoma quercina]|uniref:Uncharacterized protein n=1 Tax=Nothophoma quercina TaxID=749835 RepID=A0ABR3QXP4_9PLEO